MPSGRPARRDTGRRPGRALDRLGGPEARRLPGKRKSVDDRATALAAGLDREDDERRRRKRDVDDGGRSPASSRPSPPSGPGWSGAGSRQPDSSMRRCSTSWRSPRTVLFPRVQLPRLAPGGMDRLGAPALPASGSPGLFACKRHALKTADHRTDAQSHSRRSGQALWGDPCGGRGVVRAATGRNELCAGPSAGEDDAGTATGGSGDSGRREIYLGDRMVQRFPRTSGAWGWSFQDLGLWPGLTVIENVGYPLKIRKLSRPERRHRIAETLAAPPDR